MCSIQAAAAASDGAKANGTAVKKEDMDRADVPPSVSGPENETKLIDNSTARRSYGPQIDERCRLPLKA